MVMGAADLTGDSYRVGMLCPSSYAADKAVGGIGSMQRSYGMNLTGNTSSHWSTQLNGTGNPVRELSAVKEDEMEEPSAKMMQADAHDYNVTSDRSDEYVHEFHTPFNNRRVAYRHGGAVNLLFYDAHASAQPRPLVDKSIAPFHDVQRLWKLPNTN